MAQRASKSKADRVLRRSPLPSADHRRDPHPRRAAGLGGDRRRSVHRSGPGRVFGAIFQYPGTYGHVHDFTDVIATLHAHKAIAVVAADPLALTLLKEPGEMGADIAIGSMQRFGVPMGYGGPHAAYMAVQATPTSARCPGAWSASPSMRAATGLPAGAADPRAAYPPREGDLEHLHRAGAARRHRLDVCCLPWPGRADAPSPARPHQGVDAGGRPEAARLHHRSGNLLRHRHGVRPRAARPDHSRSGTGRRHQSAQGRPMTGSALRSTRCRGPRPGSGVARLRRRSQARTCWPSRSSPIRGLSGSRAILSTRSST
jgi:hypothetical protein